MRRVGPGQQQAFAQRAAFDRLVGSLDHDLQVLAHVGVAFDLQILLQRRLRVAHRRAEPFAVAGAKVGNLVVIAGDAEEREALGLELRLRGDQHLGVGIALLHPRGRGRRGGGRLWRGRLRERRGGQGQSECDGKDEWLHGVGLVEGCSDPTPRAACGQCAASHAGGG